MATRVEIVSAFIEAQNSRDAAKIDAVAEHLADDASMQAGGRMGGADLAGKAAIIERLKNPPQMGGGGGGGGGGMMGQITWSDPTEDGNVVKSSANLPPGAPISSLTRVFTFNDSDKITRIETQRA